MKLNLVGKNMELTDGIKDQVEKKFSKLDKYFDEEVQARVVLSTQKINQKVEVTISVPGNIIRAEESTTDLYASMDKVVDSLARQIRKYKTRLKNRNQNTEETIRFENIEDLKADEKEEAGKIVRRKKFDLRPMHEEEAILQMELLNHNFFVFMNAETDLVEVLYRRKDKNYGIIQVD